ncbi:MAG: cytochrome c maturation protein CcmE [Pseudomonadota bacterium]|nr:cytochrome c maturation protein CcmE [Pseudomonadota bacterium]
MTSRKRRRIILICVGLSFLTLSAILVGYGMRDGIEFFKTPSQILKDDYLMHKTLRLGGVVNENSLIYLPDGKVSFEITDRESTIKVYFLGILPDLFAEGKGVIAVGKLGSSDIFFADVILAKHDENYSPIELSQE